MIYGEDDCRVLEKEEDNFAEREREKRGWLVIWGAVVKVETLDMVTMLCPIGPCSVCRHSVTLLSTLL